MKFKFITLIASALWFTTLSTAQTTQYTNSVESVVGDQKQIVVSGKASVEDDKNPFKLSFDNILGGRFYTTPRGGGQKGAAVELSYKFDNATIDYITYHPRTDNNNSGNIKGVEIYIATGKSSTPKLYKSLELKDSYSPTIITLDKGVKGVTEVIFKVSSSYGDHRGSVNCAEMEFFAKAKKSYDPSKLFANTICTELNPGITLKDIERCPVEFYRTLALHIYNKAYDTEFRVATFKAWRDPNLDSKERRTGKYSLLDNPTGIVATAGEEFALFVGDEADTEKISLRIIDLYTGAEEKDGYNNSETYPLRSGLNRFTPSISGLAYVIYHDAEPEQRPVVAMNFATGVVNGYYDSQRHSASDWNRLIGGASYMHFDMVGRFVHITFPTKSIKEYCGTNGDEVVDFYDKMVRMEQEFMGFGDNGYFPYYGNRLYMYVGYRQRYFMFATGYRTCYHLRTMKNVLTMEIAKKGCWGVSHEMGHVHQTLPLMKWIGMTEVTNNIMSLYIQTEMLNQPTNLTTNNRYNEAREKREVDGTIPFSDYTIWEQLTMFWQLYLYNTKVLGNDKYYADIYQAARTNDIPMGADDKVDHGACQVRFARWACDAAKLDLTEFFEYWGLFMPTSKEVKDYATSQLTVTEEEVQATKDYIRSRNYPKPDANDPIWLITDDNYESYK